MIRDYLKISSFFFLILFVFKSSLSLDSPKPEARPEIKKYAFQDVFSQIKKQNWTMAITLADDYNNSYLSSYIRWLDITRPGSNHSFEYLSKFYKKHKHWPKSNIIIEKIESSISNDQDTAKVLSWFENNPPQTASGKIQYFEVLLKTGQISDKKSKIKQIWVNSNLTFKQQKYFIKKYSKFWNQKDNWQRFNRLIYEGKNVSARRTLNRVSGDLRKLGEARLGLSRRSGNVSSLISKVPEYLKNDPGLIYERMRWRRKAKLDSAADLLISPPDKIENVRNWWINSRVIVRRLLNKKNYSKAYKILKNHKLPLSTESGLEAEWLAGWISYLHLNNQNQAINHLEKVFNNSDNNYRAKSAYWLALANIKKNSDSKIINKWFKESAENKFSFYGQNASLKLGNLKFDKEKFVYKKPEKFFDLIVVINIIIDSNQKTAKSYPFFKKIFDLSSSNEEKFFALEKADNLKYKNILGKLSKNLDKPSFKYSYPEIQNLIPKKFSNSKSTIALIHAIVHQESNFSVGAYSCSHLI